MQNTSGRQWQSYLMAGALALSAVMNALLILKVKSEQRLILNIKEENRLHVGQEVPNIVGKTIDGKPIEVNFAPSHKPTILYVFTPTCAWCKRNFENMTALRHSVDDRYAFVGISLTDKGLAEYVRDHGIDYPVVTDLSEVTKTVYRLGGTPTTIVISPENKVLKAWTGAYNAPLQAEISSYFNIKLPGLPKQN